MASTGADPVSNEDDVIKVLLDQVHRHIKLAEFFSKLLEGKHASMSSGGSSLSSTADMDKIGNTYMVIKRNGERLINDLEKEKRFSN